MKIIKIQHILLTAGMAVTGFAASSVYAASDVESNEHPEKEIQEVVVVDQADDGLTSKAIIDRETIRNTPDGNGNMTDLLKSNVNVRFEKDAENGFQNGEIKPAGVSINGAPSSQTAYMVDGININNDIDPLGTLNSDGVGVLPGSSSEQAYFYDSSMIGSVTVYDSNVPASLGGFTGGAIVAESLFYSGVDRVGVNYRTTNHHLAEMQIDDTVRKEYEKASGTYDAELQPKYKKDFVNLVIEQGLTDELGMVVGVSRRESDITQNRVVDKEGTIDEQEQTRLIDNVMVNFRWQPVADKKLDLSLRYSAYESGQFYDDFVQNNFVDQHRAYGATVSWQQPIVTGLLTTTASYDDFNDSRDSNSAKVIEAYVDDKIYRDGGYGDSELRQRNATVKIDYKSNSFNALGLQHRVTSGLSVTETKYNFKRFGDVHQTMTLSIPGWGESVDHHDIAFKGTVTTDYRSYSAYIDNSMAVGNWSFRPGVRVERDDYLENLNVAPRFSTTWQALSNTRFIAGANRYYGRSFAAMKLSEGVTELSKDTTRRFEDIKNFKTPHADELTFGVDQNIGNFTLAARYIWRENKDRLILRRTNTLDGKKLDEYINGEDYHVDVYTLQISNIQPWVIGSTLWNTTLGFDWLNTDRDDLKANQDPNEPVSLDGKDMTLREMEAQINSSQEEWNIRLGLDMKLPEHELTWSNKVYIKAPVQGYEEVGEFTPRRYKSYKFDAHTQWDTQLRWQPSTWLSQDIYFQADLLNVLNETRRFGTQANSGNGDYGLYSPGRQLWLEVGYNF
ncbi:TonB-dependent siderophore receptor [uncultured Photobacterium sp.]|uniref:TonB-dependent receptor plug domain-containing protein n=1 Tax=uncultured Photobacterium sp. TaxID=173973 RepID=UPI00261E0655|nr:TonB-dependent receptor plug domain-containing protein [uncultured Photobacterium sp.]